MKFIRMYTGDDGETHFADLEVGFKTQGMGHDLSDVIAQCLELGRIQGGRLQVNPPGLNADYHNAPRRQLVIYLTGSREMISGTGESRVVGPGDILLAEDVAGRGHHTRCLEDPQQFLLIYLDPDARLEEIFCP